jgi:predicted Ser/Thr protein kinase
LTGALPALPGELPQRYTPVRLLGRGGMGVVVLARDAVLGREVALKLIAESAVDSDARARFLREVKLMGKLAHPGIVRLFDGGRSGDALFLTMEVLDGEPLSALVRKPWMHARAATFLARVLEALAYVHEQGILHRDLKPGNVMVVGGAPKVLDFGLARSTEGTALTEAGMLLGTPRYMAPELIDGAEHSARTDLFAVGMIGLEMIAGASPYAPASDAEGLRTMMVELVSGRYHKTAAEMLAKHGPLGEVLLAALHKDPVARPESATELADRIARAVQPDEPREVKTEKLRRVEPVKRSVPVSTPAPSSRGRLPVVVAVALFLGLAALVARRPADEARAPASPSASAASATPASAAGIQPVVDEMARLRTRAERVPLVGRLVAAADAVPAVERRMPLPESVEIAILERVDDQLMPPLADLWVAETKRAAAWGQSQEIARMARLPRDWRDLYRKQRELDGGEKYRAFRKQIEELEPVMVSMLHALGAVEVSRGSELCIARHAATVLEAASLLLPGGLSRFDLALRRAAQGRPPIGAIALLRARLHALRDEHDQRVRVLRRLAQEILADPGPSCEDRAVLILRAMEWAQLAGAICAAEKHAVSENRPAPPAPGEPTSDDLIARLLKAMPPEVADAPRVVKSIAEVERCEKVRHGNRPKVEGDLRRLIER